MDLHSLADAAAAAALADSNPTSTSTSLTTQKSGITLPSFSDLLASSTSAFRPSVSPTTSIGAQLVPAGSQAAVPDQPVLTGWSPTPSLPKHTQAQVSNTPFVSSGEAATASQPKRRRAPKQRNHPTPSAIPLEYNVRPYTRVEASSAQPTRATRSPHPLQGLRLDRTYPERSVQVWHEDAQRLLRPPRTLTPPPAADDPVAQVAEGSSRGADPLASRTPFSTSKCMKVHPPAAPWEDMCPLPQLPSGDLRLPQTQESAASYRPAPIRRQSSSENGARITSSSTSHQRAYSFVNHTIDTFQPPHWSPSGRLQPSPSSHPMRRSLSAHMGPQSVGGLLSSAACASEPASPKEPETGSAVIGHGLPTPMTGPVTGRWDFPGPSTTPALPSPPKNSEREDFALSLPANASSSSRTHLMPRASLPEFTSAHPPTHTFSSELLLQHQSLARIQTDLDRRSSAPHLPLDSALTIHDHNRDRPVDARQTLEGGDDAFSPPLQPTVADDREVSGEPQPELDMDESTYSESSEPLSEMESSLQRGEPSRRLAQGQRQSLSHSSSIERHYRHSDEHASSDGRSDHPASQSGRGTRLRLRIPPVSMSGEGSSRYPSQPASTVRSSSVSLRARSSSGSTHTTLHEIKRETGTAGDHVEEDEAASPEYSPRPKRSRRTTATTTASKTEISSGKGKGKVKGKGKGKVGGSGTGSGQGVQRRNGERRREQNAVAQKKFRWKKKQIAAQMEADLESATALAEALRKEVTEKDKLVTKLQGEVGSLKRKLGRLGA